MTYQRILDNRGFQAISRALRASTVNAITARNNDAFDPREVRYGVIGQIRRSLPMGKHEFLSVLSGYVADFNAETARRLRLQRRTCVSLRRILPRLRYCSILLLPRN